MFEKQENYVLVLYGIFFFACKLQCVAQMKCNCVVYMVSCWKRHSLCSCAVQRYCVLNFSYFTVPLFHFGNLNNQNILQCTNMRNAENYFSNFFKCIYHIQHTCILYYYISVNSQNWGKIITPKLMFTW